MSIASTPASPSYFPPPPQLSIFLRPSALRSATALKSIFIRPQGDPSMLPNDKPSAGGLFPFSGAGHIVEQPCARRGCTHIHQANGLNPFAELEASVKAHAPNCLGRALEAIPRNCDFPWQVDPDYLARCSRGSDNAIYNNFETSDARTPMRSPTPINVEDNEDEDKTGKKRRAIAGDEGMASGNEDEDEEEEERSNRRTSNSKRKCAVKKKGVPAHAVQRKACSKKGKGKAQLVAPPVAAAPDHAPSSSASSSSTSATGESPRIKKKGARNMQQRCTVLTNDPWAGDYDEHHVYCKGCKKTLKLDRRSLFYPGE
ncbi:hypothetical protein R3P38DRAFT_3596096 [Favolaschia claudopus]|uniref:Uncharacterized protein n=1 Tax=Favolaschia claudopus TaxID=2862362 RepID=A0AAW0DM33_9AGAR